MFQKAVKTAAKLRMAIAGPSGSGKTYTALNVAQHLGDRVAVVDTEHGSASKYADLFTFDVAEMHSPYQPQKYIAAIEAAVDAGYDVVILDSLSHAWNGSGGMLEMVEQAAARYKGNSYAGWKDVTPLYHKLVETIVSADIHIIGTMRSKADYVLVERNGKQYPQKVGMAPIQRDGFEYEFDVMISMDIENTGIVEKTRCPALTNATIKKPGKELADTLREWLSGETPVEKPPKPEPSKNGKGDYTTAEWEVLNATPQEFPSKVVGHVSYFRHEKHVRNTMKQLGAEGWAELETPAKRVEWLHILQKHAEDRAAEKVVEQVNGDLFGETAKAPMDAYSE